jgi:benzylsuccinate CoA-transferase BbsF subunit
MAPHGVYRCRGKDAWVSLSVGTDGEWRSLARLIGRPELADDSAFGDAIRRWQRRRELDELVGAWAAERVPAEAAAALQDAGIAASASASARDLFEDEHLGARGFATVTRHRGTEVTQIGAPWRLSAASSTVLRGPAPATARKTVFGDLLGLSAGEIAALREEGVIG